MVRSYIESLLQIHRRLPLPESISISSSCHLFCGKYQYIPPSSSCFWMLFFLNSRGFESECCTISSSVYLISVSYVFSVHQYLITPSMSKHMNI